MFLVNEAKFAWHLLILPNFGIQSTVVVVGRGDSSRGGGSESPPPQGERNPVKEAFELIQYTYFFYKKLKN